MTTTCIIFLDTMDKVLSHGELNCAFQNEEKVQILVLVLQNHFLVQLQRLDPRVLRLQYVLLYLP